MGDSLKKGALRGHAILFPPIVHWGEAEAGEGGQGGVAAAEEKGKVKRKRREKTDPLNA